MKITCTCRKICFTSSWFSVWEKSVVDLVSLGGKKQEMVAPVYQGSEVKLLGDGSSHHYKDPFKRGKEAIDGCACISRIWG